jgi:hypothetical protein
MRLRDVECRGRLSTPHYKVRGVLLSSMIAGDAGKVLSRKSTGQFCRVISPVKLHDGWKNVPTRQAVWSRRTQMDS